MIPESILNAIYVTVPYLQIREEGDQVTIVNEVLGTAFTGSKKLMDILSFFRKPRTLKELAATEKFEFDDVKNFLEKAFVVNIDLLFFPVKPSIGEECTLSRLIKEEKKGNIVVFSTPFDSASDGQGGARLGPQEIRLAFAQYEWPGSADTIADPFQFESQSQGRNGNNRTDPDESSDKKGNRVILDFDMERCYSGRIPRVVDVGNLRYITGESVHTYGTRIHMIISLLLDMNMFPVLLGGDHSITHFVLQDLLVRYKALGIIHFDAHPDLWPGYAPQFKHLNHGNAFTIARESESLKHLFQVGLRGASCFDPADLEADKRVRYISSRKLQHLPPDKVFEELPRDIPYYLSFDVDCISPYFAPETGTPASGGLTYYQAMELIDFVSRNFNLVGADFTEVAGKLGGRINGAADVTACCIFQVLMGNVDFKPLKSYIRKSIFEKSD